MSEFDSLEYLVGTEITEAITEPALLYARSRAKLLNQQVRNEFVSSSDREQLMGELDLSVTSLIGKEASATGFIYHSDLLGTKDTNDPIIKHQFNKQQIIFNGFLSFTKSNAQMSEQIDGDTEFLYSIRIPRPTKADAPQQYEFGYAKLDDVILDFKDVSEERARIWLGLYMPKLLKRIHEALDVNSDTAGQVESLKVLNLELDSEYESDVAKKAIAAYIDHALSLDSEGAYGIILNGEINDTKDGFVTDRKSIGNSKMYVKVNSVEVNSDIDYENERWNHILGFNVDFINPDPKKNSVSFFVPLSSIDSIISLRNSFYND